MANTGGRYRNGRSPYWWMSLPATGTHPRQQRSTGIVAGSRAARHQAERVRAAALNNRGACAVKNTPTAPTLATFGAWYLEHKLPQRKNPRADRKRIQRMIDTFPGRLTAITPTRVTEYQTRRLGSVSATTINRDLDELKTILETAAKLDKITANPLAGFPRLPTTALAEPRILTPAESDAVIAACGPVERVAIITALETGIRLGDLMQLERGHVTTDSGGSLWIEIPNPKTRTPYRVPVSPRLRDALASLPARIYPAASGPCVPCRTSGAAGRCPHVFAELRTRTHVDGFKDRIRDIFRRACQRAGVPYGRANGVTFHSLRHTAATRMLMAGIDDRTVAEIGGWSSTRMLERYAHPTDARKQAAVAAISGGGV